jgi:hypothetical protein
VDSLGTVTYAFQMIGECKPTSSTQPPSFYSTSASANILFVQGVSTGSTLNYGSIQDINFSRTAKPTGTPPTTGVGIGLKNAGGWIIREVGSSNSNSDFYCNLCPELGPGILDNVSAGWSALSYTSADTNLIGFDFDSPSIGNQSSLIRNWKVSATPLLATGATSKGLSLHGSAINDFQSNVGNVADTTTGINVVATSPTLVSDIHFMNSVIQTSSTPIVVSGVQGNATASGSGVDFISTWAQSSSPSTVTNSNGVGFVSYQNLAFGGAISFSGSSNNYAYGIVSQGSGSTVIALGSGSNNNRIDVFTNDPKAADTVPSAVNLSGTSLYNQINANCTGAATYPTCVTNSDATSAQNYAFVEAPTATAPCSGLQCSDHGSIGLNGHQLYRVGSFPAGASIPQNWGYIYDGTSAQSNFVALFSSGAQISSHYSLFTMGNDGGWGWSNQPGTGVTGSWACDTQFFKIAPGSVGVNNCTSASTVNGSFSTTNLTANGLTTANGIPMHTSGGLFQESTVTQATSGSAGSLSTYFLFPGSTKPTYLGTVAQGQGAFLSNCHFNGTSWVYDTTGTCSGFRLNNTTGGGATINTAVSGTAGATVAGFDTTSIAVAIASSAATPQIFINPTVTSPTFNTNSQLEVNPVRTADNLANVQITTNATTNKALVLQGTASQSANMLEVQDSTGAVKASVSPVGLGAFATGSTVNGSLICTAAGVVGCGTGSGTVTTSGSPLSGYLSFFTGATVVSGTPAATLDTSGNMGVATLNNTTSANDSSIAVSTAGTIVTRNVADGTPVMTVTNSSATSGGTALKVTTAGIGNYAEFGPAGNTFINNSGFLVSPKVTAGTSGVVVNGGTAMTANQGTGTSVQHSTGTPTSGNCTKFDATGNTVDAFSPCGTVTVAGFNAIGNIPFFGSSTSIQGTSSANLNSTGDMSVNTLVLNATGAASQEALAVPGTWFSGGTGTTTKPQVLIQPTATTSTGWSTAGTGFGVNAQSGFTGNLIDLQLNGSSKFKVDSGGGVALASIALSGGTAVTANQGTGTSLQHSTGSVTTNDCTKFDSTGNTVDAGYICTGTNESIQFPTLASALAPGDAVTFALTTTFPNGTRGILVAPYPASTDFVAAGVAVSCVEHSLGTGTAIDCTVRNISSSSIASGNNFPMILYQMP